MKDLFFMLGSVLLFGFPSNRTIFELNLNYCNPSNAILIKSNRL